MVRNAIAIAAWLALGVLGLAGSAGWSPATTVPFRYVDHEILVPVLIEGHGPYTFMLDTCTTPSIVDVSLARTLKLRFKGAPTRGNDVGGGSMTAHQVTIRDLEFGSILLRRLDGLTADLSPIARKLGVRLGGVLGSNFFDGRVTEIDYRCRRVSVLRDAVVAPFAARFIEPRSGYIITQDVRIGRKRASATFDSGNAGTIVVTMKGIDDLNLHAASRTGKPTFSLSYGGRHAETTGVLHGMYIGSTFLGDPEARFLPSSDAPFDVNIGNRSLDRFVVTLDYVRGLMTLSPIARCSS